MRNIEPGRLLQFPRLVFEFVGLPYPFVFRAFHDNLQAFGGHNGEYMVVADQAPLDH